MSVNSKMTAIADAIRTKTGRSGTLTLDQMVSAIADIETGSGRAVTNVGCTMFASNGKLIGDINNDGIVDVTDEELAAELMAEGNYDAAADLDGDGMISTEDLILLSRLIAEKQENQIIAKVTITYDDNSTSFAFLSVDAPESGTDTFDATATAARILSPYTAYVDGEKITGSMKDNSGTTQHTAGASSDAVSTGIRLAIPTSGYYTTSNRIFYSNANLANAIGLTPEKLVKGNTVIGVEGTAESGGSGDSEILDGVLNGTATEISNDTITYIRARAFYNYGVLQSVSFPLVTETGTYAFYGCSGLTSVDMPSLTRMPDYMFRDCESLVSISLPKVTKMDTYVFYDCTSLVKADFALLGLITYYSFQNCSALEALILRKSSVCTLSASDVFKNSGIAKGTGYIYVPSSLVNSYKSATGWSTYAAQIRAIEDYPDITGV